MPMSHYGALMKALPAIPGVRLDIEPLPPVAQALVQVQPLLLIHAIAYSMHPFKGCTPAAVLVTESICLCWAGQSCFLS